MLDNFEIEILKRITYKLSFDLLTDDKNLLIQKLKKLQDKGIIELSKSLNFNDKISEINIEDDSVAVTSRGRRLFMEHNYNPANS